MIKQLVGNLLDVKQGVLVHGVNMQGRMASGIADTIRRRWPDVYNAYAEHHKRVGLRLGDTVTVASPTIASRAEVSRHVHRISPQLPPQVILVNAVTQEFYGRDPNVLYADYDAIEAAFQRIRLLARDARLPVHIPLIGCGLANGVWEEVAPRIQQALGDAVDVTLWVLPQP